MDSEELGVLVFLDSGCVCMMDTVPVTREQGDEFVLATQQAARYRHGAKVPPAYWVPFSAFQATPGNKMELNAELMKQSRSGELEPIDADEVM